MLYRGDLILGGTQIIFVVGGVVALLIVAHTILTMRSRHPDPKMAFLSELINSINDCEPGEINRGQAGGAPPRSAG